jgi:hypothetical protein
MSSDSTDWVVAACHHGPVFPNPPDNPLPRAIKSALCSYNESSSILIGVYGEQSSLDNDVARRGGIHHYASGTDDSNQIWLFFVAPQGDEAALAPLARFGFKLH